ncbi:MaoC/PaaZ C-terminal domain-containing protein [Streptomyces sp. NBC_00620]|uniref:MaoC/PaaZ C-terminal domain-containing protein n=1 Tax=Streptomyces sp. NBC_00620 TaxID=2903666 RepID=UPI002B1D12D8|nr:MaoC/PaaZ C-terminal domain-containing protein [Streptomyces sp. NBC_00620]
MKSKGPSSSTAGRAERSLPGAPVQKRVRVDLARLAAYERVCGFATGAVAMPVTYPHVLAFPMTVRVMASRAFPLPVLGLVHTSTEMTQRRGLPADGEYEISVCVEGLAAHRRGTEATVVTEARLAGTLVWESRNTYLARHSTAGAPGPRDDVAERTPLPAVAEWRFAGDVGRRYGAVSRDRNPIHLYPLTARLFGFARPIAHGMWTVARCLAELPADGESLTVRAEFKAPVRLPGTVTYAAEGNRFELRGAMQRLHLTGEVQPAPM